MNTAMMDLQAGYPESPMDPEDIAYPCKGCGEVRSGRGILVERPSDPILRL